MDSMLEFCKLPNSLKSDARMNSLASAKDTKPHRNPEDAKILHNLAKSLQDALNRA